MCRLWIFIPNIQKVLQISVLPILTQRDTILRMTFEIADFLCRLLRIKTLERIQAHHFTRKKILCSPVDTIFF